ncbi:MAG TPA: TIR domain-containing protein [Ktedonobacteraceae bacterium]|nr:TIR domain-containing protein [Ktedonobacteraceae bacterium]
MRGPQADKETPLSVFISYAHEDELLRQQLETHLSLLRRGGSIADWHDRQIMPGAQWAQEIDEHLETASIILLLVSPDFLDSDYCYDIEMKRALERHQRGKARVIPIILRPCDWRTSPFAYLQCLPRDGEAVTTWQNLDEAFTTIADGLRRVIERQQIPTRSLSHGEQQNRIRLLKRVRATWIEGVLEHSLHQAALIALNLQEQPDALANPWHLEVQETNFPPRPLPAETSIVQVYDDADGELLILGEPGAGKTTLLLELARILLERAEQDEHSRLPIVFNLSSWAEKRLPLVKWLVEELWTKYQVPNTLGTAWVAADQILPLLDGLDEVAEAVRSDCVQAINTYHQDRLEKGTAPLVACCRSKEYLALLTRVNLHQAVSIQPLTDEQIEYYLRSAKGQLQELWHALHQDTELYELARRPLMLSIFTLAYQGAARADLPMERTSEAQQRQVFATYVKRMLERRGISKRFSQEQTLRWLTFVAAGMQQHHQTVFYLERLQPDWLRGRGRRLLYRLSVGLFSGLVYGLTTAALS